MQPTLPAARRHAASLLLCLSVALVSACGGGGDGAAPSDALAGESATAYAAGPISGFGSVIVNGVRYDDSAATVLDDDDDDSSRGRAALKLGMMVEIDAAQVSRAEARGKALRIRFGSEIVGPVSSFDEAGGTLVVLGQTVETRASTVFDDSLGGGLATGTVVEVHALFDAATGRYIATRIEAEPETSFYKLRGLIANLDPIAKTFTLGDAKISYAGLVVADFPKALANGQRVRVRLQTTQVDGQWIAVALRPGVRKLEDRAEAHLRGTVTAFSSSASFELNGLRVDAAGASFPDGTEGLVLGAKVEVEGKVLDGVLVASKVELDERHAGERHGFELHGAISALDTAARSFMLRNVRVSYAGNPSFKDGSAADLANGRQVEVKGTPSADRGTLDATRIEFED
jgi:hypothetical protein